MNKKIKYMLCGALMASAISIAQDKKAIKAQEKIDDYSYSTAIERYEVLIDKGFTEEVIYKNLGDANYQNAKYIEAADWYSKLFVTEGATIEADYIYKYAQSLKSSKKYDASDVWMERYRAAKMAEVRSQKFAENPDYMEQILENSGRYELKNISVNSASSDFAPAFKGEQLVFSTARDSGVVSRNVHSWTNKPFTNLYSANMSDSGDFGPATKVSSLNKKTHETSAVFTKDGSTVYFTRNNSVNGSFARDEVGVSRLKIYRATLSNDVWTDITELPFNADSHSAAHPALSLDERKLYFASDMEGTIGDSDIFMVDINEDGSIGTPKNLGNSINTEGRETFPFVTASDVLYFASDGHPGLGGLDVFATKIDDLENLYIVNVGKSVNSEKDDFSFIINEETKKGFFASNRDGGLGDDDIYGFTETEPIDLDCTTTVDGVIKDKETGQPLSGAKVAIFNSNSELISDTIAGTDGSFSLEADCKEDDYNLVASKDDYNAGNKFFTTVNADDTTGIELALEKAIKRAPTGSDLVAFLGLKPVYFDLDKAFIRPDAAATMAKVIEYLNFYPDVKIQVQSHTDTKAGVQYNSKLSQKRAENTVSYLLANNVDAARISQESYGETKLANDCSVWSKCTPERNEQNRRSEFIVMQ